MLQGRFKLINACPNYNYFYVTHFWHDTAKVEGRFGLPTAARIAGQSSWLSNEYVNGIDYLQFFYYEIYSITSIS